MIPDQVLRRALRHDRTVRSSIGTGVEPLGPRAKLLSVLEELNGS